MFHCLVSWPAGPHITSQSSARVVGGGASGSGGAGGCGGGGGGNSNLV